MARILLLNKTSSRLLTTLADSGASPTALKPRIPGIPSVKAFTAVVFFSLDLDLIFIKSCLASANFLPLALNVGASPFILALISGVNFIPCWVFFLVEMSYVSPSCNKTLFPFNS